MDHFQAVEGQGNNSASVDFPQSQELFSDQEHREDDIPHQSDNSTHNDNSHLFQDEVVSAPTRPKRAQRCKKLNPPAPQNNDTDESSDYELPPRKLTLQEIFDNHFRKKKKKKKKNKQKRKKRPPKERISKPFYSVPLEQRKRRLLHCGIRFPFASKKHLSLKLCFQYEQYILGGFLGYVKDLKYENHLQKSLKNMEADEELESEKFDTRKFQYLDDKEPLSPISDYGESDQHETEYCDAKIVENSPFILKCRIPSKEEWKIQESQADD
ncbi:PREDICTED: TATA box-binding protein-associated factor RNA polymerase I subunit D [Nanorana parkeri]|uniref:TATA box-binding protein-associated factor RNA polymerase I subunit D n=1 Tax=Nanorana parkeri TaxID=125878 RepID=UPI000854E9F9|nr:PREDICTED: TATA box-binding protein-associated factor RNA polymerase I subunit D [Nanorana parkeri]